MRLANVINDAPEVEKWLDTEYVGGTGLIAQAVFNTELEQHTQVIKVVIQVSE